jgi:hypothetical protein
MCLVNKAAIVVYVLKTPLVFFTKIFISPISKNVFIFYVCTELCLFQLYQNNDYTILSREMKNFERQSFLNNRTKKITIIRFLLTVNYHISHVDTPQPFKIVDLSISGVVFLIKIICAWQCKNT